MVLFRTIVLAIAQILLARAEAVAVSGIKGNVTVSPVHVAFGVSIASWNSVRIVSVALQQRPTVRADCCSRCHNRLCSLCDSRSGTGAGRPCNPHSPGLRAALEA